MLHLSAERLAALAGEDPTDLEAAHLARCGTCARERAAHCRLLELASANAVPGEALALPLTRWHTLAAELRREGLIAAGSAGAPASRARKDGALARHRSWRSRWMSRSTLRVAAGLLLVAGGMMAGRVSAGESPLPQRSSGGGATPTRPNPFSERAASVPAEEIAAAFDSPAQALEAQRAAELTYQQASAFLAQFDSTTLGDTPDSYRVRLAALDRVGRTMREALQDAPFDPVINGYYLATLGQREATLRQLSTSLPGEARITSF